MIYEQIRNYLIQSTSPELVQQFDDANEIFEALDFEAHLDRFDQVIGETSGMGDDALIQGMVTALDEMLVALLAAHGVETVEQAITKDLVFVLKGLVGLTTWEDRDTIRRVLEADGNAEEKLAELLALHAADNTERVMLIIESVNPSLLLTLRGVVGEEDEVCNTDYSELVALIQQYESAKRTFSIHSCFLDRMTHSAGALRLPFRTYFERFLQAAHPYLGDQPSDSMIRSFAQELVLCGILSAEGIAKARDKVGEYMNEIYSDLKYSTKLDMAIMNSIIEVQRA